jgi:hypothetical protein
MSRTQTTRLVRLLLGILCSALCSVTHSAEPPAQSELEQFLDSRSVAQTVPEILQLAHAVARTGVYQRDDFYSTQTMHRMFGPQVDAKTALGEKISIVSMHGFTELVSSVDQGSGLRGIFFEARKANNGKWSRMDMSFWGVMPGLDFEDVVKALGPGWHRDEKAEMQRDFAIMREYFNPPLPRTSHAMGRAIITYPAGTGTFILEFDTEARLYRIHFADGCLGGTDCSA